MPRTRRFIFGPVIHVSTSETEAALLGVVGLRALGEVDPGFVANQAAIPPRCRNDLLSRQKTI